MSGLWCSSWKTNHAYRHQRPSMAVKRIFLCVPRTKVAGGSECVKIMYPPPCWLDPRLIWKGEHPSPVLSEPLWHLTWPVFQSPRHDTVYEPVSFSVQIFFISIFVTIWIHSILRNFLVSFEFTSFDSLFSLWLLPICCYRNNNFSRFLLCFLVLCQGLLMLFNPFWYQVEVITTIYKWIMCWLIP